MTELHAPLTPPGCDLRRFRDMPLDIGRLRDSHLMTHAEPEAIVAALLLWGTAWHQVPAASLPDDDRLLAKYAGYGRGVELWLKVKDEALRGFVACSDGRLYHRTLAHKAVEAWDKVLRYDWEREKDRHRKTQKDLPESERTDFPAYDDWLASRAHGCKPRAEGQETAQKRQETLPLEFPRPSGGSQPVRAPARTERAHPERARTGASSEPVDNSAGNADDFHRNEAGIPPENALKERKGKEQESTQPDSSHSKPARDQLPRDGSGRDDSPEADPPGRLGDADLKERLDAVLDAAGWHPQSPAAINRALQQVEDWTKRGVDFDRVVIPSIKAVVTETAEPTRTLGRFRARVDHEDARLRAANGSGTYVPPRSPVLEPDGEDPSFRPMRRQLLERYQPPLYAALFNDVRFETVEHGDRRPLRICGREHSVEVLVHGRNAPLVREVARSFGFDELWKGSR